MLKGLLHPMKEKFPSPHLHLFQSKQAPSFFPTVPHLLLLTAMLPSPPSLSHHSYLLLFSHFFSSKSNSVSSPFLPNTKFTIITFLAFLVMNLFSLDRLKMRSLKVSDWVLWNFLLLVCECFCVLLIYFFSFS